MEEFIQEPIQEFIQEFVQEFVQEHWLKSRVALSMSKELKQQKSQTRNGDDKKKELNSTNAFGHKSQGELNGVP